MSVHRTARGQLRSIAPAFAASTATSTDSPKKFEKCLAIPAGIVTNGVILQALGETMRKFKTCSRRSLPFRLLVAVVVALLLMAALAPRANAAVLIYFNFEDAVLGGPYDHTSDQQPAFGGDNPGGGVQASLIVDNFNAGATGAVAGTAVNRTAGDIDTVNNLAIGMRTTPADNGHWIQFSFNASAFSNMSLSFAVNSAGNGFNSVTLQYSLDGVNFTNVATQAIAPGGGFNVHTFALPSAIDGQPSVTLRLTFTGGTSSGNNLQTIVDNIQLTGVPEPTTVAGGLLGVVGLCWHQRRRLRFLLPRLRRT